MTDWKFHTRDEHGITRKEGYQTFAVDTLRVTLMREDWLGGAGPVTYSWAVKVSATVTGVQLFWKRFNDLDAAAKWLSENMRMTLPEGRLGAETP